MKELTTHLGVTTVANWMATRLPEGITAYMAHNGVLYRLKRIRSYNGVIRPVLGTIPTCWKRYHEFTAQGECYMLDSAVFLSTDASLEGNPLESVTPVAELADTSCWALRSLPVGVSERTTAGQAGQEQVTASQSAVSIPMCG